MINVNQITAQLAKLPDQSLQRYAMMHKDDPYVVSLALAESNRRKQIRAGAQMQQMQQPSVADQAIQGMAAVDPMGNYMGTPLPEDVGIGRLPAKNIAKMAGGGIVAFADGGDTDANIYPPGEVVARMSGGGVPRYNGDGPSFVKRLPEESWLRRLIEGREVFNIPKMDAPLFNVAPPVYPVSPEDADLQRAMRAPSMRSPSAAELDAITGGASPAQPTSSPAVGSAQQTPPPGLTKPAGPRAPTGAAPAAAGSAMPTTAEGVMDLYKNMRDKVGTEMPASQKELLEDIARTAKEDAEARRTRTEQQQAARGLFGEEQEKRYKAREERLNKEEAQLGPMALFQAGLAIMGGTSPHGLVNIAAGAQVGLKNYQMGVDKLSAARDKLDDAFGRLEEIRRNERRLDEKELNAAEDEVQKAILQGKKDLYTANHDYFKMNREDANKAADAYLRVLETQYKEAEQTKRTNIMAGANDPLALYKALGGGDVEKGYGRAKQLAVEPKTDADFRETWAKSVVLRNQYPNVEDFVRMMKGTAALQSGQQLNPADAALINKYLQPPR